MSMNSTDSAIQWKFKTSALSGLQSLLPFPGSRAFCFHSQQLTDHHHITEGGLSNPKLVAVSNFISFAYPKAPVYPCLAQGKSWNEMIVTWTSGYNINESIPFVQWDIKGELRTRAPAGTLTFDRSSMCGSPARTVGWHDPGFIHTSFLKNLWPNVVYIYRMGHRLVDGSFIWSKFYSFRSSPYPGQDSLQRVIIFGDMAKRSENTYTREERRKNTYAAKPTKEKYPS